MATIFVPRERTAGETRVAATPDTVKRLVKEGFAVRVESGAGEGAHLPDEAYVAAGATLVSDAAEGWAQADVVAKVAPPSLVEVSQLKEGALVVGFLAPHRSVDLARALAERKVSSLSMELVPRISRAQTMDALSSQANIAGYKAVLLAAAHLDRYFPLLMTAAGTVQPAKVVVMGAGVAGLQAIATARRLGAVVEVSDIRPAVKEQVQSLGARFIDVELGEGGDGAGGYARELTAEQLAKQQAIIADRVAAADVVITTALVPGRPAPKLVTEATVKRMRPGAVIVDLAAEQGGNCELTVAGETVERHGVKILAPLNVPASLSHDASSLYARNVQALLLHVAPKAALTLDVEDEIVKGALFTHEGRIVHAPTAKAVEEAA